jgi:hypothetical protein
MTSYATIAELRLQIDKTGTTGTGDNTNLQLLLDAATEGINAICNRPDGFVALSVAAARLYNGEGGPYQWIDECITVSLVEVKDSPTDTTYAVWTASDWIAFSGDPESPDFNRTPYTAIMVQPNGTFSHFVSGKFTTRRGFMPDTMVSRGTPTVRITAKWGYATTVPTRVKEACLIQAARWFKRGESSWADAMAPANFGTLMFTKVLDPDVEAMLIRGRLVRPAIGRR